MTGAIDSKRSLDNFIESLIPGFKGLTEKQFDFVMSKWMFHLLAQVWTRSFRTGRSFAFRPSTIWFWNCSFRYSFIQDFFRLYTFILGCSVFISQSVQSKSLDRHIPAVVHLRTCWWQHQYQWINERSCFSYFIIYVLLDVCIHMIRPKIRYLSTENFECRRSSVNSNPPPYNLNHNIFYLNVLILI